MYQITNKTERETIFDAAIVQAIQGIRSSDTPILPFSIGIAGRPYNSVSTTVLLCDFHHMTVCL